MKTNFIHTASVINDIAEANRDREITRLPRRMLKLTEEMGEASEAYLNVTSKSNGKNKTWADVREELVDCVIVAVDLALTGTPDQEGWTLEEIEAEFAVTITKKLAKWRENLLTGKNASDAD